MNHWLKTAFVLAAVVCLGKPAFVMADDGALATFNIKVENNPTISDLSPEMSTPITKDKVAFHIENNTGHALYFAGNSDKEYVPVISNTTVTASYAPGQEYKLVDEAGNTAATWTLGGKDYSAHGASASAEQFASWQQTLESVIANQQVSYQEPLSKSEPRYFEKHNRNGSVVRGFW
jgi:hypothetical protein